MTVYVGPVDVFTHANGSCGVWFFNHRFSVSVSLHGISKTIAMITKLDIE